MKMSSMPLSSIEEALLRDNHPDLLRRFQILEKLNEVISLHPIDGLDLNPGIQIQHIADQVVAYMREEKKEHVDREEVILLWLTENILGYRHDRARTDPVL